MKTLVTVCARGGSKGIRNKNLMPIGGKPLLLYTLDQAVKWGGAERIVCSTDSSDIADVARRAGAEVPFLRPAELSGDEVGKVPVIRHALTESETRWGPFDVVVDLDVTAPIRTVEDLDRCRTLFLEKDPEVLFSVTRARKNPYFNMVERRADGTMALVKSLPGSVLRRQDAPQVFDMNASIYFYRASTLRNELFRSVLSARFEVCEMAEECAYDIDGPLDAEIVTAIMRRKGWILS